ncbi:invasion associated locus B family protein [Chelativorans intermedius]|uniref:Invasion associated locus B family protein n=1 Tax=Chelativorans intermedius TaxID=515947 RepID=A0ABV6D7C0_9HYPH|nr:invasion associated locus B family protein [Chelativorans intermedius]MCT8999262.1 invasion associated locus B family protein [Chelativorans intermedius]
MRGIFSSLILLCAVAVAGPAFAQATAIGQHRDWGTYSYQSDNGKVCYAMSVPKTKEPSNLNHGDIFFFVSQKPGQNVAYEPQFIADYSLQEGSKVTVTVGNRSFTMFTQGQSAWLENAAEEPQLVAAMKAGADMTVSATSGRGNSTRYTFSLLGLTAALDSIRSCN